LPFDAETEPNKVFSDLFATVGEKKARIKTKEETALQTKARDLFLLVLSGRIWEFIKLSGKRNEKNAFFFL
jgi:hypothetical protein